MTINAAHALGLADEIGSLEAGKQADLVDLARADVAPDPVLAGRRPRPDRRQAGPGRPRPGLRRRRARGAGDRRPQTLPRDSSRTVVVSGGSSEIVTDSFGWSAGSPPISWKNFASASRVVGRVLVERHRRRRSSARAGRRARPPCCGESAPPIGTQAMSTGPMSAELLLGQEVADLAEVDRVHPVELDDERGLLAVLGALRVVAVRPDAGERGRRGPRTRRARRGRTRRRATTAGRVEPSRDRRPLAFGSGRSSGWE